MKKYYVLLMVLFPLLLLSCGGKGDDPVNPDPGPGPVNPPVEPQLPDPVYPSAGNGWTVTKVAEGITYYAFSGTEPITKAPQRIFVTDIDMNLGKYAVKLGYYPSKSTASKVFKDNNAFACINAGYEATSIWIRFENKNKASIENSSIKDGDYVIPQWKSEAALYMDNDQDVKIEFTGKKMTVEQWRDVYWERAKQVTNMLTSAPMLIDNYKPVGEDFCREHPKQCASSEDPYNHQASNTNPRTAIAKTEQNHVQFIVVDGRRSSVSRGISAADLTHFLEANFKPQYALNLDGGGSSTMCVKGQGDATTHVVNYPVDNMNSAGKDGSPKESGGPDHAGERPRDTYLYVVAR